MFGRLATAVTAATLVFGGALDLQTYTVGITSDCTNDALCFGSPGAACNTHDHCNEIGDEYVLTGGHCVSPPSQKECECECTSD
jgi:hypothetical protein